MTTDSERLYALVQQVLDMAHQKDVKRSLWITAVLAPYVADAERLDYLERERPLVEYDFVREEWFIGVGGSIPDSSEKTLRAALDAHRKGAGT